MRNDQWAIHAQARANFDKVKNVFHIAELYLQEFSKSVSGLSTDGVLVKCVHSDEKKDKIVRVLDLQQQLQSEKRNLMQNEMKL
jgi:cAMP phosphodiesterase